MKLGIAIAVVTGWAATALCAQGVEQNLLGGSQVSLHLHPFLAEDELATLRFVATRPEGLGLFIQNGARFAAIAAAPQEGFIRAGQPVASAKAVSDLPDAATARAEALRHCDAARTTPTPCVILLEVAPAR